MSRLHSTNDYPTPATVLVPWSSRRKPRAVFLRVFSSCRGDVVLHVLDCQAEAGSLTTPRLRPPEPVLPEALPRLGVSTEDLGRFETHTVAFRQGIEGRDDFRRTDLIDPPERATSERREAEPHDGPHVAVECRLEHAFLDTVRPR